MAKRGASKLTRGATEKPPFFPSPIVANKIEKSGQPEYVAWVDLMGAKTWMAGSIRKAAEIIGLIHVAGLKAESDFLVDAYPVVDGIYLIGSHKDEFRNATKLVMRMLAATFLARKPEDRFLVRGGIAYGRVLHGKDIAPLHSELLSAVQYTKCLAIGVAIGQAYSAESKAPPFGYYVDMTARSTASYNDLPYLSSFDRWWTRSEQDEIDAAFGPTLLGHFAYLEGKVRELEYPPDRLREHRELAKEYFRFKSPAIADQTD